MTFHYLFRSLIFQKEKKSPVLIDDALESLGDHSTVASVEEDVGNFYLTLTPGFSWSDEVEDMESDDGEESGSDSEIEVSLRFVFDSSGIDANLAAWLQELSLAPAKASGSGESSKVCLYSCFSYV